MLLSVVIGSITVITSFLQFWQWIGCGFGPTPYTVGGFWAISESGSLCRLYLLLSERICKYLLDKQIVDTYFVIKKQHVGCGYQNDNKICAHLWSLIKKVYLQILWKYFFNVKVHIFWEGHKIFAPYFCLYVLWTKVRWRFRKILWPSQNIRTLKMKMVPISFDNFFFIAICIFFSIICSYKVRKIGIEGNKTTFAKFISDYKALNDPSR